MAKISDMLPPILFLKLQKLLHTGIHDERGNLITGEKREHLMWCWHKYLDEKNKIWCLFYTTYKDKRKMKTIQILKENLGDYMYNLRVGVTFLTKTGNPEAVREKRDVFDYIKF